MNQTIALADEDVRRMLRALSADVQTALALSRAAITAVSSWDIAAEQTLDSELEHAQRVAASQRTADILEQVQRRLRQSPDEQDRVAILERALIAAADALPIGGARAGGR